MHFWLGGVAASIHLFIDLSEGTLVSLYWSTNVFSIYLVNLGGGSNHFHQQNLLHIPLIHRVFCYILGLMF